MAAKYLKRKMSIEHFLIVLLNICFLPRIETSFWRPGHLHSDIKEIEAGTQFILEYAKPDWFQQNLSWYSESPWCTISDTRLAKTLARCTIYGACVFGIKNGSEVQDFRVLKVNGNNEYYSWDVTTNVNRTERHFVIELYIKVVEPYSHFHNQSSGLIAEHILRLSKLFQAQGELPVVEYKENLKSSKYKRIEDFAYNGEKGEWHASFFAPLEIDSIKLKISSASVYSLFDKFIRPATRVVNLWNTNSTGSQGSSRVANSTVTRFIQNPCYPNTAVYLSEQGVFITQDLWKHPPVPLFGASEQNSSIFIDDLVFIGQKLIFIENTTVFSLEQNGVVYKTGQGLPADTAFSLHVPKTCHEVSSERKIVAAVAKKIYPNSIAWIYLSVAAAANFVPINCSDLWEKIGLADSEEIDVLDVYIHSVFQQLTLLINRSSSEKSTFVLLNYHFATKSWVALHHFGNGNLQKLAFPLSTSNIVFIWSERRIISYHSNTSTPIFDLDDYDRVRHSMIKQVITDSDGRFVISLGTGDLFTGIVGVSTITKISSINPNFVLAFDTLGYLVAFDTITGSNSFHRSVYPLHVEIDSAAYTESCEVVSFEHNGESGWYQVDLGDSIEINVVLISYNNNTEIKILKPPHSEFEMSTHLTSTSLGRYYEKKMKINVFIVKNATSPQSVKDVFSSLVVYPSNISSSCKKSYHKTAFIHLGCPSLRYLNINQLQACELVLVPGNKSSSVDIFHKSELPSNASILNAPTYCATVSYHSNFQMQALFARTGNILRPVQGDLQFTELNGRRDFFLHKQEVLGLPNYSLEFGNEGIFIFNITLDNEESYCRLNTYLIVTHESLPEAKTSLPVIISVILGISMSLVFLVISFLRYRHRTMLEHEREAEIVKRQQELRYLTNLHEYGATVGMGSRGRQSIKESIQNRKISLSAISEMNVEI